MESVKLVKGYFSSFLKFSKSFSIFFLFSTVYFVYSEKEMYIHVELLSWFPPVIIYAVQTLKQRLLQVCVFISFMIIDIFLDSPITESIYLTVLIGCFTVRLPHCVELHQTVHMPYFWKQLKHTACRVSPHYRRMCVVLALSILVLGNHSIQKVKKNYNNVKLASKNSSQHAPQQNIKETEMYFPCFLMIEISLNRFY